VSESFDSTVPENSAFVVSVRNCRQYLDFRRRHRRCEDAFRLSVQTEEIDPSKTSNCSFDLNVATSRISGASNKKKQR